MMLRHILINNIWKILLIILLIAIIIFLIKYCKRLLNTKSNQIKKFNLTTEIQNHPFKSIIIKTKINN